MRIWICLASIACCCAAYHARAAVTSETQAVIRENTFEVVMKKPEKDPVSYEKPLPLDLLPFIERTDAYRSVGTAFALGNNTYVTAGHVFVAGVASQFGPPALRRSDGVVFKIDRILKFSFHEDYVVFSLQNDPGPAGFGINRTPRLDEAVLAVGNALGEGIVIRDGLFTSETPEAQDGRWKWIRFSAAASPGNSGGPLCDSDAKVIGIVIGKSPNENLNYSLPIARVLDGEANKARFDQKSLINLSYLHGTATHAYKDEFNLPLVWPAFVEAFQKVSERHGDEARALLLKTYDDTLFPKGPGSQNILSEPNANDGKPRLITQQADGTWIAETSPFHEVDLPDDGSVGYADQAGVRLIKVVRSGAASDDAFYGDSRLLMELLLKGLDLRRQVGADQVRVTSLGPAKSDVSYTDVYGRRWQERVWAIPYLDAYLVGELLPTPDGYVGIVLVAQSVALAQYKELARLFTGQFEVSYRGSLSQWRAALGRRSLLPSALSQVSLEKSAAWTLRTPRFVSGMPADVLSLTEKSPLTLTMGFMSDGRQTVWDIQGVLWDRDDRRDAAMELWRRARPPAGVKLELRNQFDAISQRRSPYDGTFSRDTPETYSVVRVLDVPGKKTGTIASDLEYGVTLHLVGHPSSAEAVSSISKVVEATHVLEHGFGEDIAKEKVPANTPLPSAYLTGAIDEYDRVMSAKAAEMDDVYGKDLRGRLMSQDFHDYMTTLKSEKAAMASKSEADQAAWMEDLRSRFSWFQAYWSQVPALMHNRNMFVEFLAKNHLPPTASHGPGVLQAEGELLSALATGQPRQDWSDRASHLRDAYIQERRDILKSSRPNAAAPVLTARTTACPPPAATTTGNSRPRFASDPQGLESYWPMASRRMGEEGTVIAVIRVSATGCVTGMSIVGFSGSDMLDHAVLDYLESVSFTPAGSNGNPMESTVTMPIAFKLQK